jgi:hypothetical protein
MYRMNLVRLGAAYHDGMSAAVRPRGWWIKYRGLQLLDVESDWLITNIRRSKYVRSWGFVPFFGDLLNQLIFAHLRIWRLLY